ncbi:glycosyltransferase family 2 protein [Actibacterium lipolyticum]|uniref:Glycosyl transferase family 2 n=1 Tax=Actibacterium lipolyticum TaxID=1524263 RepID=A0A238KVG5_9RHOB|nr:glycosyltransferase family 2 protein [Actibacterium lipolyticum]SMX46844.1 hypothetical protein COL8621_03265 [Actibacterium lipolyticum]
MRMPSKLWTAYRLRLKRRRYLFRAFRKRRQLTEVENRTADILPSDILAFATVRNELIRLPHFLDHYRKLGVGHFLFVDNQSDDGTAEYLRQQPDVSLWSTGHSYKAARFGVDWLTWLQVKYGHGHWCLTLDADELLVYPYYESRPLAALTAWLDSTGERSFGAMMLDMYPEGRLDDQTYVAGEDPIDILGWFDSGNYIIHRQPELQNLWVQGGVRARSFFANNPRRAPTLSKTPLVKWNRRFAYVSSTHSILPPDLNHVYDDTGGEKTSGILLHTKFLHTVIEKSREEKLRKEHFAVSSLYDEYYDSIAADPVLWTEKSTRYRNWRQLEAMGLMSKGGWL